jgi:protein-S-isoprenylcysteine O-methyltransferase Ste14
MMERSSDKVKEGLWKFVYWPLLWVLTLVPPYILYGELIEVGREVKLALRISGIVLVIWAFLLHGVAGRTLRYFGHKDFKNKSIWPDRLVIEGIYSCMRHPQHLGLVLVPIALALIIASPIVLLSSGWAVAGTLLFILFVEEPECLIKFGKEYYEYMKKVKPFNLDPRCLVIGIRYIRAHGERRS